MQKKLIALAIAGIVSAPVFAQSNVTVYGRADMGFVNKSGGNNGGIGVVDNQNSFASGVQSGSRIGFKGAEDLGNGMKAIFQMEFGTSIDSGAATAGATATWSNRNSHLGLTGNFGTILAGRLDGIRYGIFNRNDAFGGGTVGNFTQMTGQVDRADNTVAYISPNWNGFTLIGAYGTQITAGTQEAVGNRDDARLNSIALNYANGPLTVDLDVERVQVVNSVAINKTYTRVSTAAISYDFGFMKLSGLTDSHKVDTTNNADGLKSTTTDYVDYFVSVKVPFAGKWMGKATWGKVDNRVTTTDLTGSNDASKFGVGLDYSISKRTNIYMDYGKIVNNGAAAWHINQAANANGNNGTTGFDIGLAHNF
jgi:predicted porin